MGLSEYSLILKNDGTLLGCGRNAEGQLGLGDKTDKTIFTQVTTNADNVKSVYCGKDHNIILKNDGTLWGCGNNQYGQLGLGDTTNRTTFTQVTTNVDNIKEIYCGSYHTLILKNDGTLWSCGRNDNGQLGLGDGNNRTTFTQITANTDDIKLVYCGSNYTLILKNDGTLWGCGYNGEGQLGLGGFNSKTTFTQITTNTDDIKSVYCGSQYTLILKNDGTLWGTGYNSSGGLGLGDTNYRTIFTQITTNTDNIKSLPNQYIIPTITKVYDLNAGLIETLDTNNFKNIPVDKFEKIKVLYTNPAGTYINCLVSFDQKQTWKTFTGSVWNVVSDTTPSNIQSVGMDISKINELNKDKLIAGGFTGNIDFKITLKTNDDTKTPSITKIYIEYKK